ncbi:hypothetical protein MNBD_GAMMA03-926 [hydrothermal vent metagenome]|uniref:Uncharacterized protein n=1 Tax=hydrothermal vent metagenome TaxID=652676 RepID=A0A3B0W2M9_9ZZZZ
MDIMDINQKLEEAKSLFDLSQSDIILLSSYLLFVAIWGISIYQRK